MAPAELSRDAVERHAVSGHDGTSRAGPERVRLAIGRGLTAERVVRGWDLTLFADTVPTDVAGPVPEPLDDVRPLVVALAAGPVTHTHGDAAEHPGPAIRRRDRADPDGWVRAARTTLERGGP